MPCLVSILMLATMLDSRIERQPPVVIQRAPRTTFRVSFQITEPEVRCGNTILSVTRRRKTIQSVVVRDESKGCEAQTIHPVGSRRPQVLFWMAGADYQGFVIYSFRGAKFRPIEVYSYLGRADVQVHRWKGRTVIRESYDYDPIHESGLIPKFKDLKKPLYRDFAYDAKRDRYRLLQNFHQPR